MTRLPVVLSLISPPALRGCPHHKDPVFIHDEATQCPEGQGLGCSRHLVDVHPQDLLLVRADRDRARRVRPRSSPGHILVGVHRFHGHTTRRDARLQGGVGRVHRVDVMQDLAVAGACRLGTGLALVESGSTEKGHDEQNQGEENEKRFFHVAGGGL
ncbi:MAG: hypothetical protein RBS95_10000 [Desulfobulbus sp.]|nr:hypothetical protein [Desulfobulbus sp.]